MQTMFIVGNKFKDFCHHDNVITLAQLQQLVLDQQLASLPKDTRLLAGQGLREADIQQILRTLQPAALAAGLDLSGLYQRPARASRLHTHKHQLQNAIISHPLRLNDTLFEVALMVDDRSELMGDHATGQHIQGMVLIEAARQTFLAVTEEYFIGPDEPQRYYFVINSMAIRFQGFVFPLDATLRYQIVSMNVDNRDRMRFDTLITVLQGGKSVTQLGVQFTAFLAEQIEAKEQQQATLALQAHWQPATSTAKAEGVA